MVEKETNDLKLDHDTLKTFPESKVPHLCHSVDPSCLWPCRRVAGKQTCLHVSIEILFSPGCVPLPSKGRTHLKELATGGREEASWSRSQPHHCHPYHPGGLLRAHLHAQLRARGRRCLYTLDFLEGWVRKGMVCSWWPSTVVLESGSQTWMTIRTTWKAHEDTDCWATFPGIFMHLVWGEAQELAFPACAR